MDKWNWDELQPSTQNSIIWIGSLLDNKCREYALSKMDTNDYVSLHDTKIKCNISIKINDEFVTIKHKSIIKFNTHYENKIEQILNKLFK